jgi:hypothetical protein
MSEAALQKSIVGRAKRRGWKVAHAGRGIAAFDSEGNPVFVTAMSKGWPDLFLAHPKLGAMAIECKKEGGIVEPEQQEWLQLLNLCGIPSFVIRPSHLRDGRVNVILGSR